VKRIQLQQRSGNPLAVFDIRQAVKRSRLTVGNFKGHWPIIVAAALKKLIQAAHGPLAALVDQQIARNGKQPCLKPRLTVVLPATDEHAHPNFLEQVLCLVPIPSQIKQIPQQTVLVADDQFVHKTGILTLEPGGYGEILLLDLLIRSGGVALNEKRGNCIGTHLI
jgi:hypothetical protein